MASSLTDIMRQLHMLGGVPDPNTVNVASTSPTAADGTLVKHTPYVMVGDAIFFFVLGTAAGTPAATSSKQRWPANTPFFFFSGDYVNISILAASGSVNVSISKLTSDPEPLAASRTGQYAT